ncbi:MAG: deoxyribonuclease IV [Spirochaetia bacterium]|nr:deoxyribonuclease IV [Spirochaetia bacterium]
MPYFGFHASISGGIYNAIEEAQALECGAMQIFTANQRTWQTKDPAGEDMARFKDAWEKSGIEKAVSHNSYLVNLASADPANLAKSRAAFEAEMRRVDALKLDGLVFHPGSFTGSTYDKGLKSIIESVNSALAKMKGFGSVLLFETTAGSGNSIGGKFEDIAAMLDGVKQKDKAGVCFDTAHVFEAGYDLKNDYEGVMKQFDRIIGTKMIKAFHMNDSKTPFNSHSDRHMHIGQGELGKEFFGKLVNDKRFRDLPMIIETPADEGMDKKNLDILRKLCR